MSITVNCWEIWLARVAFEEDPKQSKIRPVLVLDDGILCVIESVPITSHAPRTYDFEDYQIQDWISCGLNKQSTIRFGHITKISDNLFVKKLGTLSKRDMIQARIILKRHNIVL